MVDTGLPVPGSGVEGRERTFRRKDSSPPPLPSAHLRVSGREDRGSGTLVFKLRTSDTPSTPDLDLDGDLVGRSRTGTITVSTDNSPRSSRQPGHLFLV